MEFNKLFSLLEDNQQSKSLVTNISQDRFEVPFLLKETVNMLSDESPYLNIISDTNKVLLVNMIKQLYDSCMHIYFEDLDLDKFIKQGKLILYKVDAPNGLRLATSNEIANGVKELVGEYFYPCGEEDYKKMCLLNWTFNGRKFFFTEAGFKLTYTSNKETKETLYDMIQMSAHNLKDLFVWASIYDNIESAISKIKKLKSGYKYASYEKDEIEETISIKQLIYNIDKQFPRNSDNPEYRKAIALMIKGKTNIKNLSPLDVAYMRKVYYKRALDTNTKKPDEVNEQLKSECETLLKERYKGKIKPDHFVYNIITTLKNKNYKYCSVKQYNIIKSALDIIKEEKEDTNNNMMVLDDTVIDEAIKNNENNNIENISDQLGEGLLFEDMFNDEEDIFS